MRTIRTLLDRLERVPQHYWARFDFGEYANNVHSYRGYYEQLSIGHTDRPATVSALVGDLRNAIGNTFTGYKGGEYTMRPDSGLWVSNYGAASGLYVIGVNVWHDAKTVVLSTALDED